MRTVLGIDAAWTSAQPSGVALAAETDGGWRLVSVVASYQHFIDMANPLVEGMARPIGCLPQAGPLLHAAKLLSGRPVDLVAIDMPLSHVPIVGRRVADNAVSRAYGGRKCGTHTPSVLRPGPISDALTTAFLLCGYPLQTLVIKPPGLIEVYPHPALVELTSEAERLPYKASKVRSYWPLASAADRRISLYRQWAKIIETLDDHITGTADALPALAHGASGWEMKAYEDKVDAIVCACVAISALERRAVPFGDSQSAIWIPEPFSKAVTNSKSS